MDTGKFDSLIKYLEKFGRDEFGNWNKQTGDGSKENPFVMPYFIYDEDVNQFVHDFYELNIINYSYNEHMEAIERKPTEELTEEELITKLTAIIRGDRFCEGLINSMLKDGTIQDILTALKKY